MFFFKKESKSFFQRYLDLYKADPFDALAELKKINYFTDQSLIGEFREISFGQVDGWSSEYEALINNVRSLLLKVKINSYGGRVYILDECLIAKFHWIQLIPCHFITISKYRVAAYPLQLKTKDEHLDKSLDMLQTYSDLHQQLVHDIAPLRQFSYDMTDGVISTFDQGKDEIFDIGYKKWDYVVFFNNSYYHLAEFEDQFGMRLWEIYGLIQKTI